MICAEKHRTVYTALKEDSRMSGSLQGRQHQRISAFVFCHRAKETMGRRELDQPRHSLPKSPRGLWEEEDSWMDGNKWNAQINSPVGNWRWHKSCPHHPCCGMFEAQDSAVCTSSLIIADEEWHIFETVAGGFRKKRHSREDNVPPAMVENLSQFFFSSVFAK